MALPNFLYYYWAANMHQSCTGSEQIKFTYLVSLSTLELFVRLLENDIFSFFLKLFHCIIPRGHFLQPAPEADHRLSSLSRESGSSTHSFSDFSVHYLILAVTGHQIIKEQLPQRKVLHEQAPTAACPDARGL